MDVEAVARVLDRTGGRRHAGLRVPPVHAEHPETRRILSGVAIGIATAFVTTESGAHLSEIVWYRLVMISPGRRRLPRGTRCADSVARTGPNPWPGP